MFADSCIKELEFYEGSVIRNDVTALLGIKIECAEFFGRVF